MNRKIFYLFIALSIALFSLGTAHPVSADPPDLFYFNATYVIPDLGVCQDAVTWQSTGYYVFKGWPSVPQGYTKTINTYGRVDVTVSANGKSLKANVVGPVQFRIEQITDTFAEAYASSVGPIDFIVAPGMGPVFGFAGRIVDHWHSTYLGDGQFYQEWQETVSVHGKSFYDIPAFCAYFGSAPK
jgi:hypothetical protein